jgi:hypothetical protein
MRTEPEDIDMSFTVTVTYNITTYGKSRFDCYVMAENMGIEEIHKHGEVVDIEIGDGVPF